MKNLEVNLADIEGVIRETLNSGGKFRLTVTGSSMSPLLKDGVDEVILRRKDVYSKPDVVLYKRDNGQFVLHRILGKNDDGFILRGDAQREYEHGIRPGQIIGYMCAFTKKKRAVAPNTPWHWLYVRVWTRDLPWKWVVAAVARRLSHLWMCRFQWKK